MFMALVVAACHEEDAVKTLSDSSNSAPRIASFSPALSATVVALGWGNALVGRTPWCVSTAPIVGSLNDVDLETLMRTKPNLILIQQTQVGAPPQLEQAARAKNWNLEFIPATSLDDIRHLPGAVEKAVGQPAPIRAQLLVDALEKELSPCAAAQKLSPAILLYSDEPIGAFGADTYLAQAWVAMGGTLALPNKGNPNLSLEELFATQPKSIIVIVGSVGDKDHARPPSVLDDACPKRGVSHLALYAPKLLLPGPELATGLKLFRAEIEKFCQPMTSMNSPNISTEQMNGDADKP
jgi:ABC-type hemin transport system substrate-binding protein